MAGTKLLLCGLVALSALSACGGDDKQAVTGTPAGTQCAPGQYFDGRVCQATTPAPTAAAPAGTVPAGTAPAATGIPGLPNLIPVATAASGPTATPIDPAAAAPVTILMTPLAPAGFKAVGAPVAGNFTAGQSLESTVQMNAGKCYTVVGVGLPGVVQNLDVQLVQPTLPGMPNIVLAADNSVGSTAILGQNPCYKAMLAGTLKLIVTVTAGQGIAAAQVYEK